MILKDEDFNQGNVWIVTGAESEIGRATAIATAVNGLTSLGIDINEKGGKETDEIAREMG